MRHPDAHVNITRILLRNHLEFWLFFQYSQKSLHISPVKASCGVFFFVIVMWVQNKYLVCIHICFIVILVMDIYIYIGYISYISYCHESSGYLSDINYCHYYLQYCLMIDSVIMRVSTTSGTNTDTRFISIVHKHIMRTWYYQCIIYIHICWEEQECVIYG